MRLFILLLLLALCLPEPSPAAFDPALLEEVSRSYARLQPGLDTYQVDLETAQIEVMLSRMTANMPPEMPRPKVPTLRKYWVRQPGAMLIRAEGQNVFPYMQQMVERFSREFALELRSLFLPVQEAENRRLLLRKAEVRTFEAQLGETRTLSVEIDFAAPTDLGQAFYAEGLELPRQGVTRLTLDLDPDLDILRRMEISAVDSPRFSVEIRHRDIPPGQLPGEILITTPDGRIDERFLTTFDTIDGFRLPVEQVHSIERPGRHETISVRFRNYRINIPLPADVLRQLNAP